MHLVYSLILFIDKKHKEENIRDLIENIKWESISINNLLDVTYNFPLLRINKDFQCKFKKEIKKRFKSNDIHEIPRKSYKYKVKERKEEEFLYVIGNALLEQREDISTIINNVHI